MSKFRITTLDQLGTIITGKTPSTSEAANFGGDIPFVTPSDMDRRRFIESTGRYLTEDGAATVSSSVIPPGAIMVSCIGSDMGKAAIAAKRSATNQQINSIIVDKGDDPLYVYYNLSMRKEEIRAMAGGSAQPILNKTAFGKLSIQLPDVTEQQKVSALLGSLDDKIELNQQINHTLETLARRAFQHWFIDFGPARAKSAGQKPLAVPEKVTGLFPDKLDENGQPSGWKEFPLTEFAELNPETWNKTTMPTVIEYVDLSNTKWGCIESTQQFEREEAPSRAQRVLRSADTIVGTVRPGNGSYAYVGLDGLTGSTGFAVLRPNEDAFKEFVYLVATSRGNIERLTQLADGGAYPAVRPDVVGQTMVWADKKIIAHFSEFVSPLFDRIEANKTENTTLQQLKTVLLPKLMAGTIRVSIKRGVG